MGVEPFEEKMRKGGGPAIEQACRFFMGDDPVHNSMRKIAQRLDALSIPYAIAGGMSLSAHGFERNTVDVDLLVTREDLSKVHKELEGLGYLPPFTGSRNLRDVETGVAIEFLISGAFPGDGKPKPVAFPDPRTCAIEIDGLKFVTLPVLFELKLASGMTNPGRIKDLGDAQELIRLNRLTKEFATKLNPYVRDKFVELWSGIQADPGQP
jgi:hypothetical protein